MQRANEERSTSLSRNSLVSKALTEWKLAGILVVRLSRVRHACLNHSGTLVDHEIS